MKWLQDNWLMVFSVWAAVNATVLAPISAKVAPVGFWGKLLHVLVAISPADVLKAFKTVGAELVVPVAMLSLLLLGCGASQAEREQAAVAEYGAGMHACNTMARSRDEADACREIVWEKYCAPGTLLGDAGACEEAGR